MGAGTKREKKGKNELACKGLKIHMEISLNVIAQADILRCSGRQDAGGLIHQKEVDVFPVVHVTETKEREGEIPDATPPLSPRLCESAGNMCAAIFHAARSGWPG